MTLCQTFPSPEAIRAWANTTVSKKIDGLIQVQYYKDQLYYYFALSDNVWTQKMTSISPLGE
jgi:hypothetical protein